MSLGAVQISTSLAQALTSLTRAQKICDKLAMEHVVAPEDGKIGGSCVAKAAARIKEGYTDEQALAQLRMDYRAAELASEPNWLIWGAVGGLAIAGGAWFMRHRKGR
jgi:hypothetical protein